MHYLCKKNADIKRDDIRGPLALVLKGIFSKTTYVCVLKYQLPSFQHNFNEVRLGGGILMRLDWEM